MSERLLIHSYRRVFRVDRRIYRVDRWALPVPGGVPLRGFVYFAVALGAVLLAEALPLVGALVDQFAPPLRYVVVPLAVAVLGTHAAPDGRPAHRFAWCWLRLRVLPRRRSAGRRVPLECEPVPWSGSCGLSWDASAPALRCGRVEGPARVTFAEPVTLRSAGRRGIRARASRRGATGPVVIGGGQRLEVRR